MNAREILKDRQGIVRSIAPDATVFEAVEAMDKFKVGALMVIDKSKLVGIISERDYTRKVMLKDRSSKSTKVSHIMTHKLAQVGPEASIEKCMDIMGKSRIRHLPVVEKGKVLGVISSTDLLLLTVSEKDHIIEQLERYIAPGF
ncbi:MAG: CBS domain-containing protein [Verrucomicrobiota bacterium]|jgi:CBS domain-containing protein|nr:CBS domain-containing protein [Verrucomicrobiota bacterium]MDP6250700.1 CBS domain-containing protein [Verrucomicrobiota bacterium]MDP7176827.1 CBS domain-containing protein [Verrucomicrobiota bacterium]MDP7290675.1 CBS domain-containing protein [Verrucomicrobiota bacterium]MDP7440381.1 CBS domain-containing protein [Verrucomicrobiota bacterium]|tara:strand:- start:837 stop:1268 length:432 start_codon:yes stop_codon:yes gene_type:complete